MVNLEVKNIRRKYTSKIKIQFMDNVFPKKKAETILEIPDNTIRIK